MAHALIRTSRFPLALLAGLALALAGAGLAQATGPFHHESFASALKQAQHGQLREATIYESSHRLHLSARNGTRYTAPYTTSELGSLTSALRASHTTVHTVAPAHHHGLRRRYIALIVLVGLLLIGGAAYLLWRRRPRDALPAV